MSLVNTSQNDHCLSSWYIIEHLERHRVLKMECRTPNSKTLKFYKITRDNTLYLYKDKIPKQCDHYSIEMNFIYRGSGWKVV